MRINEVKILEKYLQNQEECCMAKIDTTVRIELLQENFLCDVLSKFIPMAARFKMGSSTGLPVNSIGSHKVQDQKLPIICKNYLLSLSRVCIGLHEIFIHRGLLKIMM